MIIVAFLLACVSCVEANNEDLGGKVVLAYVTSWSQVMPDPSCITHINYAFGHVTDSFDGVRIDNEERLRQIVSLKKQKSSLKVMLSIGGWGSGRFSEMSSTEMNRKAFAKDCQRIVKTFGLDGIDIDWEYPTSSMSGISSSPNDTKNFTLLMKAIRKAIGKKKILSIATAASAEYIDFNGVTPYLDYVNIMSYDMGNPPYHHAGLYRSANIGGICADEAVKAHIKAGVPAGKLVLGIPFYGRGTKELSDFMDYKDILKIGGEYIRDWDETAKVPYMKDASGRFVCGYEDARSIAIKCQYIMDNNLHGAMYWEYAGDDENGTLRKAVFNGINSKR